MAIADPYLNVGTPLWKKSTETDTKGKRTETRAVMPKAVTAEHNVFVGVTTRHREDSRKEVYVQHSGLMLVRVKGGSPQTVGAKQISVNVGDKLVRAIGQDWLVKQSDGDADAPVVGVARETINTDEVRLIWVMAPSGGGGGGGRDFVWL